MTSRSEGLDGENSEGLEAIDVPDDAIVIALDQGGQSSRAIAYDVSGEELARATRKVTTTRPAPGHVELDGEEILCGLRDALDEVLGKLGHDARRAWRIGLATQRSTVAFWDEVTGELQGPCLSWQDTRGARILEGFADQFHILHEITGLYPSAHHGVSKLAWAVEHLVPVKATYLRQRLACGPLAGFLVARLTGQGVSGSCIGSVDPNNAGRTLLWNRHTRDWDSSVGVAFGLGEAVMPRALHSEDEHGFIETRVGALPLDLILGDQPASMFAAGEPDAESARVNLGTGAFIMRLAGAEPPEGAETQRLLRSLAYSSAQEETWVVEGTVNGGASALRYAARQLGLGDDITHLLDVSLKRTQDPPLFLNAVSGLGSPDWRTDVEPHFFGPQAARASAEAGLAAVLESIVFLLQRNLDRLQTEGPPLRRILCSGGLSQSDRLMQRMSDLSGLVVERPPEVEATARGTAFLLAGRPKAWAASDLPPAQFEPEANQALHDRYTDFSRELDQL